MPTNRFKSGRVRGFSLLEAIVALAVLSSAGLALLASLNTSAMMVERSSRSLRNDVAMRNALAWLDHVNLMEQPSGIYEMTGYDVRWSSKLEEPLRDGETGYLQPSLYQLGLYRVQIELEQDGELVRTATIRRVGYRQVRQSQLD